MFWDNVAWIYDLFADVLNGKVHKVLYREVAELVSEKDDLLECACGTGMFTVHVAPVCHSIVATDFSEKMLKRAAVKCKKYGNASFESAEIIHLAYADGRFDAVIAANVIHLIDEPLKALAELDRVCKPGGKIIISTYLNQDDEKGKTSGFAKIVGKAESLFFGIFGRLFHQFLQSSRRLGLRIFVFHCNICYAPSLFSYVVLRQISQLTQHARL